MALSHSFVRGLQDAVNDNLDLLPSEFRRMAAPVIPLRRPNFDIDLPNLTTRLDVENSILWARMKHGERACYTPELMQDMRDVQRYLREQLTGVAPADMPFRYLVWASEAKGVYSLGGDLTNFTAMIRSGDEAALRAYAHRAIEIIHDNYLCLDLPILTVALVQGDAIGGGFEAMLSDDIVIAEKDAKFGLPEILFNLFPGMGAYSFLKRKLGMAGARELIESGLSRSADEMKEMDIVDVVCEPGEGEAALLRYIEENAATFNTRRTLRHARRRVDPVSLAELEEIVDMWTDLAMQLTADDLRRMDCLARVQTKKRAKA